MSTSSRVDRSSSLEAQSKIKDQRLTLVVQQHVKLFLSSVRLQIVDCERLGGRRRGSGSGRRNRDVGHFRDGCTGNDSKKDEMKAIARDIDDMFKLNELVFGPEKSGATVGWLFTFWIRRRALDRGRQSSGPVMSFATMQLIKLEVW